jgi:5-methylthioadenosine/S-adenosylhomocysteine deaminase
MFSAVRKGGRRVLLKGGTIVTMNRDRHVGVGDVYIEGDTIRGLGEHPEGRRSAEDTLDVRGRLVIPGFVQPHVHLCQTLFRGRADGLDLLDWLRQRIWPFEAAHDRDSLYLSATVGAAELLRSGTTAILDMGTVHHTDAIFEACKTVGIRATIGKAMMDAGQGVPAGLRETTAESIAESLRLIDRWHGKENGRLRYAFAPRFVLTCSEELLVKTVAAARARRVLLHTHASESSDEIASVREKLGRDNVAYLHGIGFAGDDCVLAHCVWLTSEEQRLLAESKTHVAHCPSSNLKLASGIARVPDLLGMGINVCLAADGAPCNNMLDAFSEMRLCALIHKPRNGPQTMPAETVLEMATIRGARALGLEHEIGSLEEGKKADITVVNPMRLHAAPAADPYSTLVYSSRGDDVEHVFVDGTQRVRKGRVLAISEVALVKQATKVADAMAKVIA